MELVLELKSICLSLLYVSHQQTPDKQQVAQWATIAHLGASIVFGDTIIDDAQGQVTLYLKQ